MVSVNISNQLSHIASHAYYFLVAYVHVTVGVLRRSSLTHLLYRRCGITRYVDPAGKDRTYEIVERTTRPELAGIDSVDVVSKLV